MKAFFALYQLFLRHQLTRGRIVFIVLISAAAIGLSLYFSTLDDLESSIQLVVLFGMNLVVPIIALTLASGTFGQLVEDETLVYLWLRPNSRWTLATSAWLATTTVVLPAAVIPMTVATQIASADPDLALAVFVASVLGALAYTSVFIFLGLLFKKSTLWGLLYIFLWEGIASTLLANDSMGQLSIVFYIRSLITNHVLTKLPDFDTFGTPTTPATAITALVCIMVVGLLLTVWRLNKIKVA